MNILVTGATGFIGRALVTQLLKNNQKVIVAGRSQILELTDVVRQFNVDDIKEVGNWSPVLSTVDVVIHTAARVHVIGDTVTEPLTEFRKVNTAGTLNIARQAAYAGVKRFIFISSIKVNGEITMQDLRFKPNDLYVPTDPYALSKYEAEKGLLAIAKETGVEVVIIRPPLVYGPGVKANFYSMIKWMNKGVPLPFGAVNNKRSLLALDNLVDFIIHCSDYEKTPQVANQVFLISDGEDVSTTELLRKTAKALGKKPRLIPIPVWLMQFGFRLLGKRELANRLFGSLLVDSSSARNLLDWKPVTSMDEQLNKVAEWYLKDNVE
jgi:UDP-N-acetyl-alpha-D-quinovosamine dehydrogenase